MKILQALKGESIPQVPVWLMRQAGRILPEYRALRSKVSGFKELVSTPELATEVTLQPIRNLETDAAIIFSDILVIPEALGLPYQIIESKGPYFEKTIQNAKDIENLDTADIETKLAYVGEAISMTRKALDSNLPLIGFAGSPFTVLCYMVEGQGSKTFSKVRRLIYQNPNLTHRALEKITAATIDYLKLQIKAGVDVIQVFDSWGTILHPDYYRQFSLAYIEQIGAAIDAVPKIAYVRGNLPNYNDFKTLNYEGLSIDYPVDIERLRSLNPKICLQGNLDPACLYADKKTIFEAVSKLFQNFGKRSYIANLGQGVYPDTPLAGVKYFIEAVRSM